MTAKMIDYPNNCEEASITMERAMNDKYRYEPKTSLPELRWRCAVCGTSLPPGISHAEMIRIHLTATLPDGAKIELPEFELPTGRYTCCG